MASPQPVSNTIKELRALVDSIASNAHAVLDELEANGLPPPSMSADAPSPDFLPVGDTRLQALRRDIVGDARLLADTFSGPRKYLMDVAMYPNHEAMSLRILYNYDLAKHVPLNTSISYAELAAKTGLDEARLTRIIRFLITLHFFVEPEPGTVAHSAATKLLATEQMSMDYLGHSYEDVYPACYHQLESLRKSPRGQEVTDCGMALAFGNGKQPFFAVLQNDPQRMTRFNGAMQFVNARGAHLSVEDDLLINFDWRSAGDIKVVDVGGSRGHTSMYILKHAPNIQKVIVQDLPEVIEEAKKQDLPAEVAKRISFVPASFFEPQPIKDADIYVTRMIFHDWPDEKALQILHNLVPSMKVGSKLIVNDYVVHDNMADADHPSTARISRRADLQMMVALNAKERSVAVWKDLAAQGSNNTLVFESAQGSVLVFRKV